MNLKPANENWYFKYIAPRPELNVYKDTSGNNYLLSAHMAAKLLLPLVLNKFRYEPVLKKWFEFNKQRWTDTAGVYHDVLDTMNDFKTFYERPSDSSISMTPCQRLDRIHGDKFISHTLEILQKFKDIHTHLADFDSNRDFINTPGGFYNLLKEAPPEANNAIHLCKQITSIAPLDDEDGKKCPMYMNHLKFCFNNDPIILEWIEQISGYILTGHVSQEFYWFSGLPGTGKSTIANVWSQILQDADLGGYAWSAPQDQFTHGKEKHATYDLKLAGKRLILIEELKGRWDEKKLKAYTSGNRITANAMHTDPVSFMPTGKLLFTSNNQPSVDGQDQGLVRRMRLYGFTNVIPTMIDKFADKVFAEEGPYIFNRMIKYARKVLQQNCTLDTPVIVFQNTKHYFNNHNWLQQFIEDCLVTSPDLAITNKKLYTVYTLWCSENGYDPVSMQQLGKALEAQLLKRCRIGAARGHQGIALNASYASKVY